MARRGRVEAVTPVKAPDPMTGTTTSASDVARPMKVKKIGRLGFKGGLLARMKGMRKAKGGY